MFNFRKFLSIAPKYFRLFFNSQMRKKGIAFIERMSDEGVNIFSRSARKAWIRKHRPEVKKEFSQLYADSKTRKIGRNEPCPCESGKKFKKCCIFRNDEENKKN